MNPDILKGKLHIGLIGCGNMGGAMAKAWIEAGLFSRMDILNPSRPSEDILSCDGVIHYSAQSSFYDACQNADVVVLAVKPQVAEEVCRLSAENLKPPPLIITAIGGKDLNFFERIYGKSQPIIRCMPNTPASIAKGITAAVQNEKIDDAGKNIAARLLSALGETVWLDNESNMDAVTAISGSGPAYIFYLIEVLEKSAAKLGLSNMQAKKLARQTVIGAAALAEAHEDMEPSQLRQNVTSPNGTTEAALKILMDGRLQNIFDEATARARIRATELGS